MTETQQKFLYLVQHGEAKSKEQDPERPLTEKGKSEVTKVAAWAAKAGLQIDQIRHSGKLRAQQTAQVFGEKLGIEDSIIAVAGLAPNDNVEPIAGMLEEDEQTNMLVGHLPFLSRLASRLVVNDSEKPVVHFRNGGIVGLTKKEDRWVVDMIITPKIWI